MALGFGSETRRVVFEFVGRDAGLRRASSSAEQSLAGTERGAGKLTGAMGAIKAAAPAAAAAVGAAAAAWAIQGVSMAETADLVGRSFQRTFGDIGGDVLARNDELRKALGLTEAEMQKYLTALAAGNITMGQSTTEAAAFAEQMIRISADVAAFNGEINNSDEVLNAMQSALAGSFESLDRYGISITAAEVAQRALADSGKASAKELTELDKRMAALALINERASLSQGAFNEAMADGATASNEFGATMGDAQTKVGAALVPLKQLAAEVLVQLADILIALAPLLEIVTALFRGLAPILKPVIWALGQFADGIEIIVGWVRSLVDWLGKAGNKVTQFVNSAIRNLNRLNPFKGLSIPGVGSFGRSSSRSAGVGATTSAAGATGVGSRSAGPTSAGPTTVINVTAEAGISSPMETGQAIADVLRQYTRNNGPLDIEIRD